MQPMVTRTDKKNKVRIEAYSNYIIRVRQTQLSEFKDFDFALTEQEPLQEASIIVDDNSITTAKMRAVIDDCGTLIFSVQARMNLD